MMHLQLQKEIYFGDKREMNPLSSKTHSVIYLHPSIMKSLNCMKDTCVLVTSNEGQLILKCWPHKTILPSNAALNSTLFQHYVDSPITVKHLENNFDPANKIYLCTEKFKNFMVSEDFQSFLEKELNQVYIRKELKIHLTYFGHPCSFTVKNILSNDLKKSSLDCGEEKDTDLCTKLKNLSFSLSEEKSENIISSDSFLDEIKNSQTSTPLSIQRHSSKKSSFKDNSTEREKTSKYIKQEQFYYLHSSSKIFILQDKFDSSEQISFNDIIGLEENIEFMKFAIASPRQPEYRTFCPRGILLIGPPGSGKSMIGQALKNQHNISVHSFEFQDIKSHKDEDEKILDKVFNKACNSLPSIIFLDDLDRIFRTEYTTSRTSREEVFIQKLIYLIYNALNNMSDILVIATAQNEHSLPPHLRKNNFFMKELQLTYSTADRKQMLLNILQHFKHFLSLDDINEITDLTNGFTYGELLHLCRTAQDSVLQENYCKTSDNSFTLIDLKKNIGKIKSNVPFNFEVPDVRWSDIGGMDKVKVAVTKMVDWPFTRSHLFKKFKIPAPRGILLYGPPGCCKTMIAQALVNECKFNFISVKALELFNKYVGESEKSVSEIFKKARASAPCVLFFDEIDSLTSTRGSTSGSSNVCDRILTQLLVEIDGIDALEGVSILAATNRPDMIDPSFLRPGRFDERIYVGLPDEETRRKIFEVKFLKIPISQDVDVSYLIHATDGYSGAEIAEICLEASKYAMKEDLTSITSEVNMKHFVKALREISPKTTEEMKQFFKSYEEKRHSSFQSSKF